MTAYHALPSRSPLMTAAEVGRYLLGQHLKRLRKDVGLPQTAAQRAGLQATRLSHWERGLEPLTGEHLTRLLRLYQADQITGPDVWALHGAIPPYPPAGQGEVAGELRDRGPGRWERLTHFTDEAELVIDVSTEYLPPRVQIAEYATALVRGGSDNATDGLAMALTGSCGTVRGQVVVAEPVLTRTVGEPRVMTVQLEHLLSLVSGPAPVTVRVVPLGVVPAMHGLLRLLTPNSGHPGLVVRNHPDHVGYHTGDLARTAVRQALTHAADEAGSAALIRAAARQYGVTL